MATLATARPGPTAYTPGLNSKKVNIALQGGGAHGAFAWGVLDKLLEDGRVTFDAA